MDKVFWKAHKALADKLEEMRRIEAERDRMDGLPPPPFRVVLTNGCFDVLHIGHVQCLKWARERGDCLVVAVNDDWGVKELKGDDRPVNFMEHRLYMLEALKCVDFAVPFHGTKATELFRTIRPDVYVKGGDYTLETLDAEEREALLSWEPKPEFLFFPFMTDISTTKILERGAGHAGKRSR